MDLYSTTVASSRITLNKTWNLIAIWVCFNPFLHCFKMRFQTNTLHPQSAKINAHDCRVDSSKCWFERWSSDLIVPCSWRVLRENVCALMGTQVCESQKGEPAYTVHEHMKIFTPKNAGYTLHDLLNGFVCSHYTSVCAISHCIMQWKLDTIGQLLVDNMTDFTSTGDWFFFTIYNLFYCLLSSQQKIFV